MSVDIPPQYLPFVQEAVASGQYPSEAAMLEEALRLLMEQETLKQAVQRGFDQVKRGECLELDEIGLDNYFDQLIERASRRTTATRQAS
jgi:putative addiction module CopG family antidote